MVFAGIWFVSAQVPALKFAAGRTIVAGTALALAGVRHRHALGPLRLARTDEIDLIEP